MLSSFGSGDQSLLNRIRNHSGVRAVNDFMRTPWFVLLIAVLTAVSNAFSLELALYTVFILIGIYVSLFGSDYLPLMPIVICSYIAPSMGNNPGRNPDSIFYPENGGIYLIILAAIFVVSLIFRLLSDPEIGGMKFLKEKRYLTGGMLVLGVSYLLSGIGIKGYGEIALNNLLFAFIQFAAVFLMYFIFAGAVKWDRVPKDYLAWIGLSVGFVVMIQLLENYVSGRVFIEETMTIDRERIATGWGMHNNVGGLMAMMLPFVFYHACRRKHGWIYNILGTVLLLGVVMSCSRTSMIVAGIAYCVCAVILLRNAETRKTNLWVYAVALIAVIAAAILFWDKIFSLFKKFLDELFVISSRDKIYVNGIKQFLNYPVFGGSFYPRDFVPWDWANLEAFSSFFPPRWHNTLIQIAASCGIVGLVGYFIHRFQTVKLLLTNVSTEKLFIAIYVAALLAASLLDCHFFNVGPVLFYSMALAFAEKIDQSKI